MRNKMQFVLIPLLLLATTAGAQNNEAAATKKMIDEKNYVFVAQTASPTSGRLITLTSSYDLTIAGDSVVAFLPYFGRAYTAPINNTEGGIKFTSWKQEYSVVNKSKKWEIYIRPKDAPDVQDMYLDVYDNGTAQLRITSQNRQSISFNGYLKEGTHRSLKAF